MLNENQLKSLRLQTYGKNELKRLALEYLKAILPQLNNYVGQKVKTQTGWSKKFSVNVPELKAVPYNNGNTSLSGYFDASYSSFKFEISLCLNGGKYEDKTYYCQYFKTTLYLGEFNNNEGILTKVETFENIVRNQALDSVIDFDDQIQKIEKLKELENQIQDLKYSIKLDF